MTSLSLLAGRIVHTRYQTVSFHNTEHYDSVIARISSRVLSSGMKISAESCDSKVAGFLDKSLEKDSSNSHRDFKK